MQVGLLAPSLLSILRFCQGLGLGGEWSGAALLVTETAPEGKRAWAAMWPQLGAPFGFMLANGFFLLLTAVFNYDSAQAQLQSDFLVWGWRIPFLCSVLMVGVGLYVRLKLEETPVFSRAVARGEKLKTPLTTVFKNNPKELVLGTFIMVATYVLFYLMTTWILSYAIGKTELGFLGIGYRNFLVLQLISVLFFAGMIPVSGWLADRFGRRNVLMVITAAIMVFGLSFDLFLSPGIMGTGENANMNLMLLFLCTGMALMGLTFGPMSAILPELFPTNVRYTGSGIAYNFASILGAALTPFSAVWLAKNHGVGSVGIYLTTLSALTFIAIWLSKETRHTSLDTLEEEIATISIETTSP
jgi:MFS family permease